QTPESVWPCVVSPPDGVRIALVSTPHPLQLPFPFPIFRLSYAFGNCPSLLWIRPFDHWHRCRRCNPLFIGAEWRGGLLLRRTLLLAPLRQFLPIIRTHQKCSLVVLHFKKVCAVALGTRL